MRSHHPRRSTAALTGTVVATGVVAAGAAIVGAPDLFGLTGHRPFVWTVPFRVPIGVGLAGVAVVAGLSGIRWRRVLPSAAAVAVVAVGSLGTTLARGVSAGDLPTARDGDVTVMAANVLKAEADPAGLTRLVVDGGVDVVSLPESTQALADDVAARVGAATGTSMQVFFGLDEGSPRFGTALLVSDRLGEYRVSDGPTGGVKAVVTARPVSGAGPVLAAAHTAAPVPELLEDWAVEVQAVADWCADTPGSILAGDLNATLDHPGLHLRGSCVDAGEQTGTGAHGTWPAKYPAALGATIDHALADGNAWRAVGSSVQDIPGSDHRALLARWRPVGR